MKEETFKETRIDVTDWPAERMGGIDLEKVERIERGNGKVMAVMRE